MKRKKRGAEEHHLSPRALKRMKREVEELLDEFPTCDHCRAVVLQAVLEDLKGVTISASDPVTPGSEKLQ